MPPHQSSHTFGSSFLAGARDTFPLIVGAMPFGLIFGTLAQSSGLSFTGTLAMSAFVFAGSAQFIALSLIAAGTAWPIVVLTTGAVNLRHALYSATLAPYISRLPQRWQLPLAFWLTDETFAVVIKRYTNQVDAPHNHGYYLGSALSMYLHWQFCTFLGLIGGQMLPHATEWGLDFAMPVTFIGMVIPYLKNRAMGMTVTVAGLVSLLTFSMPHKLGLMVATLAGVGAGLIFGKGQNDG
jgi:4-azaleucine resistance transporter AzlC